MNRCEWAGRSALEQHYHDNEWGEPIHGDRRLFEFLILEGAQAGLSWSRELKKRAGKTSRVRPDPRKSASR